LQMEWSVITTTWQQYSSGNCYLSTSVSPPILECRRRSHPFRRQRQNRSKICAKVEKPPLNEENSAFFHPSIWGDFFLHTDTTTPTEQVCHQQPVISFTRITGNTFYKNHHGTFHTRIITIDITYLKEISKKNPI
jgi:hypothetical protein